MHGMMRMGDFGLYDEYTSNLFDTLARLNLYKPDPFMNILRSFGKANDLMMSPAQFDLFNEMFGNGNKKKKK